MFWILAFLVVGGTYSAVERIPAGLVVAMAASIVVLPPLLWFNGTIGVDVVIHESWQFLSGVETPADVIMDCPTGERNVYALLFLPLALINAAPGMVAVVGIPTGIVMTVAGVIWFLFGKGHKLATGGLEFLTIGLGGLVIAGLVMRLINWVSTDLACS